jgi:quercetin dioxygenase-like cupin family protein
MSTYFIDPMAFAQSRADKAYKYSFLETEKMLCGINCLLQGQAQPLHDHPDQDKFYLVISGRGQFTVDGTTRDCGPGVLILAPAGVPHGVVNEDEDLLTFMTVIAPWHTGH